MNDRYYRTDEDGLNVIKLKQDGSIQVTCLTPDRKKDGLELNVIIGSMITQDLTMNQHKVELSILLQEMNAEDRLFILPSIPLDRQGSIRLCQYLAGLKEFQSIWHMVSKAFGMVNRKEGCTNREESNEENNIKITDARDLLELALMRLGQLIGNISTLHCKMHLDIYEQNTSSSSP